MGKATTKPIIHPFMKVERNLGVQPILIVVIVKVMVVSNARVIKNAINSPEYFLSTFKIYFTFLFTFFNQS